MSVYVCTWKRVRKQGIAKETDNVSFTSRCETRYLLLNPRKGARRLFIYIRSPFERQPER